MKYLLPLSLFISSCAVATPTQAEALEAFYNKSVDVSCFVYLKGKERLDVFENCKKALRENAKEFTALELKGE